jgi:2'-hydroxybiphenyl-2-sulfinate desulfinase
MTTITSGLELDQLWYTRCPVPTASGVAYNLGWLTEEFAPDGLSVRALQDAPAELRHFHLDHALHGLFREGGSIPALVARSNGAPSRLIGLTWIDEWQSILVRSDSPIDAPEKLRGVRVGIPAWDRERGSSIWRGMGLAGFAGALRAAGLNFSDVTVVEVPANAGALGGPGELERRLPPFEAVADGRVDAIYTKGALSAEVALQAGLVVGIDLDSLPSRVLRVNNGTPRPITVHEELLAARPDLVARFLAATLRASEWAADHLDELRGILARETGSSTTGVDSAYRDGFHRSLHPDLSAERLTLFAQQKSFLLVHGFLTEDFDLDAWVASEPLEEARALLASSGGLVTSTKGEH